MKFKNEIFASTFMDSIGSLGDTKITGDHATVISLNIAKSIKIFRNKFKDYNEIHDQIVKQFGTRNPNGTFRIEAQNLEEFNKTLNLFLNEEFELDINKIILPTDIVLLPNVLSDLLDIISYE